MFNIPAFSRVETETWNIAASDDGNGRSNSGVELEESLPLPIALKPLLKGMIALAKLQLSLSSEAEDLIPEHQIILSVMLIVRSGNAMHRVAYATHVRS
jgi:hypothetical protein